MFGIRNKAATSSRFSRDTSAAPKLNLLKSVSKDTVIDKVASLADKDIPSFGLKNKVENSKFSKDNALSKINLNATVSESSVFNRNNLAASKNIPSFGIGKRTVNPRNNSSVGNKVLKGVKLIRLK